MVIIGIALPILAFIVVLVLIGEVHRYKSGRHFISARRLGLRLVAGFLLLALMAMVFIGLFILHLRDPGSHPQFFITFWSVCLLIAVSLILVMLADLREVGKRYTQRQHEIWRDFANFLARQGAKPTEKPPQDEPEK
jgi:FtsH-binding integral membrane protein